MASVTLGASQANATGFTETVPEGVVVADVRFSQSWLFGRYDDEGEMSPLIDEIERYEPGGGLQGVLTPNAQVNYSVLLTQLQLGLTDQLTLGVGLPIILNTTVDPDFVWTEGDYQWALGRRYSQEDFWQWAGSMGQPKPGTWTGNQGVVGDIILGARLRFTDWIEGLDSIGLASALMLMYAVPTGQPVDGEEIVAAGTTMWELQFQGDLAVHLGIDKSFEDSLDDRLTLGVDVYYDRFFPRTYDTPRGETHPLLLNFEPYVGPTFEVDPGDFAGFSVQADVTPYRGPANPTWITGGDADKAADLPPILSMWLRYTYAHIQQSDYTSDSELWDWDREELWLPGYRNILTAQVTLGLLRLGVPALVYASFRTVSLLPGKNARAADVFATGVQVPVPLW
jgi:hypothetical protein